MEGKAGLSWEQRMSRRHAERQAAGPLEWVDACEIGDPDALPGHRGHHMHVTGNATVCSCGQMMGIFSYVPDPRNWSDDPAEIAQVRREEEDWLNWVTCTVCGAKGVQLDGLGWPPAVTGSAAGDPGTVGD